MECTLDYTRANKKNEKAEDVLAWLYESNSHWMNVGENVKNMSVFKKQ